MKGKKGKWDISSVNLKGDILLTFLTLHIMRNWKKVKKGKYLHGELRHTEKIYGFVRKFSMNIFEYRFIILKGAYYWGLLINKSHIMTSWKVQIDIGWYELCRSAPATLLHFLQQSGSMEKANLEDSLQIYICSLYQFRIQC